MEKNLQIVQKLRDHVQSRGGAAKDADGNYIGTFWPMILDAANIIERIDQAIQYEEKVGTWDETTDLNFSSGALARLRAALYGGQV